MSVDWMIGRGRHLHNLMSLKQCQDFVLSHHNSTLTPGLHIERLIGYVYIFILTAGILMLLMPNMYSASIVPARCNCQTTTVDVSWNVTNLLNFLFLIAGLHDFL